MNTTAERMRDLASPRDEERLPAPPLRKESYTTWLYVGLAVAVAVLTVIGFW